MLVLPIALTMASCGSEGESEILGGEQRLATLELDATFPAAFSYLSGIRELSDGRILAADPTSQVLVCLDMGAGSADTIGRQGPGPQEYEGPDRVFALPGDSTLLVDLGNGRLTVIDPEGTFVAWTPMTTATEDGMGRTIHPNFVDSVGNLYDAGPYSREGPPDTTALHRIDRVTREETRVAAAWHAEYVRPQPGAKRPMLILHDDWAIGSDGRVAVIRANGYSVDWYFPDGSVAHGPPNEVETFPLVESDMEAGLESMSATGIMSMALVGEGGTQSLQMSRGIPASQMQGIDGYDWPETLPVFRMGGAQISPRGNVWVERFMPAGAPGRMEVFDEQGNRVGFIELPPRSKIIGFGVGAEAASTAYVARTDDVGLIWLERYRILWAADRY
jgi:hypothetical protein